MVMPLTGRVAAAVAGGLLVLPAEADVTGTLIVPRPRFRCPACGGCGRIWCCWPSGSRTQTASRSLTD